MDTNKKPNNRKTLALLGFSIMTLISFMFAGAPNATAASSAATFVGSDTVSQGNWQAKYGADGRSIASSLQNLPSYASFTPQNESSEIWAAGTTDVRGLQTASGRIGSAWYAATSFSMDVNLTDGNSHQVALYGVDWFSRNRSETIQIVDATSGAVLDSRTLLSFVNGTYLVWNVRGHVKVNVLLLGGLNVVASGVFFGGAPSSPSAIAPAITTQPAGQTVVAGQPAAFSVADTGTAPLLYQWSKNGTPISGANSSSYTTPATVASDNGASFAVAVSNTAGIATSNAAALKVNAPTLILSVSASSVNFGSVNVSAKSTQTVTLTNTGSGSVTISSVSVSGPGFNASGIPSGTILALGQSAPLTAAFSPASSGSATGSISIASNATSATTIALSGAGSATAHSVALSWSPSSSSVVGYNVYVSTVSGSLYTKLTAAPVNTLNYVDGSLQTAQNRYYVVTAVNSDNTESVFSSQVTAIIP